MLFSSISRFDATTIAFFQDHRTAILYDFFSGVSFLAEWWFIVGVLIVFVIIFTRMRKIRNLRAILAASLGTEVFVFLLKAFVHRTRPPYHTYSLFASHASFPSGHTAMAVSFYGILLYIFLRRRNFDVISRLLAAVGTIFILLVGFSRVYIGVHYPSDVLAGLVIGMVFLILSVLLLGKRKEDRSSISEAEQKNRKRSAKKQDE